MAYTGQHKDKSTSIVAQYQSHIPDKAPVTKFGSTDNHRSSCVTHKVCVCVTE